ncbi:hypothetical protein [Mesotoga sp. H07.pep.5.3]|uniref:hypothetical protein n=1 Tax=Mesotoga sp. H07.pep.5.3 TaxID=1421003 RepID=UPI00211DCA41|nr:hypothetical protein [Mesotoga sp. H07.pep.5.3]
MNFVKFDLSGTISDLPLFFPFALIYSDLKIAGPVPSDFIVDVLEGRKTVRPFGDAKRRPTKNCDRIETLSRESLRDACLVCTNGTGNGSEKKSAGMKVLTVETAYSASFLMPKRYL